MSDASVLRCLGVILACLAAQAGEAVAPVPGPVALGLRGAVNGLPPFEEVAAAGFPATAISAIIASGVLTSEGQLLRGKPGLIDHGKLPLSATLFGQLQIPIERLAAVILAPTNLDELATLATATPGATLLNGDRVVGTVEYLNDEAAGIDTGKRVVQVPRARIAVLVLRPVVPPAGAARQWLLLGSGDRLVTERITTATGAITITNPFGALTLPSRELAALWSADRRVVPFAALKPLALVASDQTGARLPVVYGRGFPLVAGGIVAADGLILPAKGTASWPVVGATNFQCWVVAAPGSVGTAARIVVDGKVVWEKSCAATPLVVSVPLAGARELTLCADPAADGETAASAVAFCHPLVTK